LSTSRSGRGVVTAAALDRGAQTARPCA